MDSTRKNEIITGLFVVAAVVVFTLFAFNIVPVNLPFVGEDEGVACESRFMHIGGLRVGDRVVFAGKPVGRVTGQRIIADDMPQTLSDGSTQLQQQMILVSYVLTEPSLRLNSAAATVRIEQDGLLGRDFLSLDPGPVSGKDELLINNITQQPLVIQAEEAAGLAALVDTAIPVLEEAEAVLARVNNDILHESNTTAIRKSIADAEATVASIRTIMDRDEPDSLFALVTQPMNVFLNRGSEAIDNIESRLLNNTFTETEKLLQQGQTTAKKLEGLTDKIDNHLDDRWPEIEKAVDDLVDAAQALETQVNRLGDDASLLMNDTRRMVNENRPELREATRRLRRTLFEAEMTLRKVRADPSVLLFGDDEKDFAADPTDEAWLIRTGRAQPYTQRDEAR